MQRICPLSFGHVIDAKKDYYHGSIHAHCVYCIAESILTIRIYVSDF